MNKFRWILVALVGVAFAGILYSIGYGFDEVASVFTSLTGFF
jgi:hypothetical protein